jgi:putative transposase
MAYPRMTVEELLSQLDRADVDVLATIAQHALQQLIEAEATAYVGAAPNERTESRRVYRNGYRPRVLDTRVGRLELGVPKLRSGTFYPSLLEPRRRIERALMAVVQEAYVHGVSTRKVDDLVAALGGCSISKSEVSRICQELDVELDAFRERRLDEVAYPYLWIDATYQKVRENGRIVSQATAIAIGVSETGEKSILAVMIGASESAEFWLGFCRALLTRGLRGVQLVTSDAHEGLKAAIAQCFAGASWQRCKVHFLRNATAAVTLSHQHAVTAVLKGVFTQPTSEAAHAAVTHALSILDPRYPTVAQKLRDAEDDLLAYYAFPEQHRASIASTNPLERLNAEIDRRTLVVGIFPNQAALLRLATAVLVEQHDEWQDGKRQFSQRSMRQLLHPEEISALPNLLIEEFAA